MDCYEDIVGPPFKGVLRGKMICEFHKRCRKDLHIDEDCSCAWELFGWVEECVRREVQYLKGEKESGA
jgi:hypothetical protein